MRHTLVRLTGLLIALMLVLTGCNLIGVDPIMQLDEDFAALKKQYSGVLAKYDGGEITQADVMASYTSQYSYMSQLYSMYGMSLPATAGTDVLKTVVEDRVKDIAIAKQIEARGLTLDADKLAEIQAEADEHYQEAYDSFYANAKGENDAVRAKQTEYDLATYGYTKEGLYDIELATANRELIEQTVRNEIAELTDEQLQAAYDEKLAEDEEAYASAPGSFESAMSSDSDVVTWIPEGYRTVKHILVKPSDDALSAVTTARSALSSAETSIADLNAELDALNAPAEETEDEAEEAEPTEAPRSAEEIQADIDAAEASLDGLKADVEKAEADCLASEQEKLDEIYGKLEAGEDFESVMETYGEDPGMQNEPTKTRGYYVCADSTTWDKNFTAGAMALENVGDYSQTPVISSSGIHIIRYESDATPGAVALDDIREALYDSTLENMKSDHYTEEEESWITAMNAEYTLDNFNVGTEN